MGSKWSFGDEPDWELPFQPGKPYCHRCGEPTSEVQPGLHDRCRVCHYHLHTCRNCMFDHGTGCLLLSPQRWHASGIQGLECPYFAWRDDEAADRLDEATVRRLRKERGLSGD